ncbi:hypothetical protein AVEN_66495-1 [Araneus ventricosus]|uniref:Integrase catalytic domain-containing protein n=1 Tax=Araneus ventricosus TaxID=182803 RepID=A0A4Y2TJI8_ARAVE|nr:hypothetical protein AVEN_66495-1 [Araneus ventricosus]
MENDLVSNPMRFWSYFKNKNINSLDSLFYNNVRYNNDGDIANAFADYFGSVFKPSTDFDGNDECKNDCVSDLVKIENVTYDDVVLAISELKSSLTVGVDNIPSFNIKGCSEFSIYPLLVLFNLSLRTKVFPGVWKQTKIIPVLKKGDAQNCKNYRPIAILSPFSKIFESIIHKKLYNQVRNLISTSQHGFIPKRSITTNLFCLTDKIISSFESGSQLDVIYTDFSKAFDSIDFGILFKKVTRMVEFLDRLDTQHTKSSIYYPMANGLLERAQRTMKESLASMCESTFQWSEKLLFFKLYNNNSIHSVTKFAPAEIFFGRKQNLPLDSFFEPVTAENESKYLRNIRNNMCSIRNEFAKNEEQYFKNNAPHIKGRKVPNFNLGDKVFVKNFSHPQVFQEKYKGPFEAIKILRNNNYVINSLKDNKTMKVNVAKIFKQEQPRPNLRN